MTMPTCKQYEPVRISAGLKSDVPNRRQKTNRADLQGKPKQRFSDLCEI